jgi:quinol monooxygenase YgiN
MASSTVAAMIAANMGVRPPVEHQGRRATFAGRIVVIIITGSIVCRPETFDEMRDLSFAHVARSRTEDGCLHHAVHVDTENPLRLVFFEQWRDKAAVLQHFVVKGSRDFSATARQLAAKPPSIALFDATEIPLNKLLAAGSA